MNQKDTLLRLRQHFHLKVDKNLALKSVSPVSL